MKTSTTHRRTVATSAKNLDSSRLQQDSKINAVQPPATADVIKKEIKRREA